MTGQQERYYQATPDGKVHERPVREGFLDLHRYVCGEGLSAKDEPHEGPATCKACRKAATAQGRSETSTSGNTPPPQTSSTGIAGQDRGDGWPEGYSWERSGVWYEVFAPDGTQVLSGTPSGKFNGEDAAQEAAWEHRTGQQ